MLNFIVLGLIPGTHLQVTLKWIFIFVIVILATLLLLMIVEKYIFTDFKLKLPSYKSILSYIIKMYGRLVSFLHKASALRV